MKYLALTLKDAAGNDVTIQGAGGIPTGGISALSDILRVGMIFLFLASIFLSIIQLKFLIIFFKSPAPACSRNIP